MSELYKSQSVADCTVLITGATAGIGEAIAWRFAEAGAKLIICGRRTERLEALSAALVAKYPSLTKPHCATLDVQQLDKLQALPSSLPSEFASIDILVNNAGLALGTEPVWSTSIADVQQMIGTNVTALIALTTAVLPGMRARGKGHLINISSIAGHEAYAGGSVYCASKFAVSAYTTAARHDLVETPIRVTQISPAAVNTEFSTVRFGAGSGASSSSADPTAKADAVYANFVPLVAADIADNVLYAATRPPHVTIADMVVYPTNQGGPKLIARVGESLGGPQP